MADLLQVFYDAGGYEYLLYRMNNEEMIQLGFTNKHLEFLEYLVVRLENQSLSDSQIELKLHVTLSKKQRYKLRKANPGLPVYFLQFSSIE